MIFTLESIVYEFWWLSYFFLATSIVCFCAATYSAWKGCWLRHHRNTPISDPIIAEALKDVQPPKFWLMALLWSVLGTGFFVSAVTMLRLTA